MQHKFKACPLSNFPLNSLMANIDRTTDEITKGCFYLCEKIFLTTLFFFFFYPQSCRDNGSGHLTVFFSASSYVLQVLSYS